MKEKIYKWSVAYGIGRALVRKVFWFFYAKIETKGMEHIPSDRPVILAPNHQNALMDALAAIHELRGVQVFMARADIFQNKHIARILHFLKIMPVFRMRDGYENLGKNEEIFNDALEVLENTRFLCIMPEGTHSEFHQLRPLVKGMFRLAFNYIEKNPDKPSPVIVPVGIDYSNYSSYRTLLRVEYGAPIDSAPFYEIYKNNPAISINQFRDNLSDELKKYMIHIESSNYYDAINFLRELLRTENAKSFSNHRFSADKDFTVKCNALSDSELEEIKSSAQKIQHFLKTTHIESQYFLDSIGLKGLFKNACYLLLAFPIFLAGYLFHILPVRAPRLLTNKVEDHQFHSSIKFVVSLLLFPLWYFLFLLVFWKLLHSLLFSLTLVFLLYLAGEFAWRYYQDWRKFISQTRLFKFRKEKSQLLLEVEKIKNIIYKAH